ncbi:PleD family two-component system response regulator [Oceanicaulis sp. MMSF_3324]|uniref:PleD family two-component system response regulator n=1 Tax=Oceanicaulis sp. MMSF_3324 TaxID=3046702 RepID=UPI00273F77F6|nr:PleD family two-component system response regulator [Oceanicaulis sp. MMSF_3324]
MSARILVVDDIETNRRLLEARLTAEYFDVLMAPDGPTCLDLARSEKPDVILLDIMMPGMDGFETCRRLKSDPESRHIPVVMVTALDERTDRIRGLEAGADEFLTKPVDDVALFARVRSLLRLTSVMDELRQRESNGVEMLPYEPANGDGRVVVAAADQAAAHRIARALPASLDAHGYGDPRIAISQARHADLVIVDLSSPRFDGLRLCARIRSDVETRQVPLLGVVDEMDKRTMVRALDLGVNDVISRPLDPGELSARSATQLKRKRYADALRDRLDESLEMSVRDALTGLFNRRYTVSRLRQALDGLRTNHEPVTTALIDIDHFKRINDTWGHNAGDQVLKEICARLSEQLRAIDIAGRYGGEEFLVVFSNTTARDACDAMERARLAVCATPVTLRETGDIINVTMSVGVAEAFLEDSVEALIERADTALYEAKRSGRNRVIEAKRKAA